MKIEKINKKKNSLYELTLSNKEKINLYDDVILKYELLLKKEIDDKLLKELLKENSYLESYHKAIKYINSKLRTEKELRTKLKDYDLKAIDYTINRLKKEGFLNDLVYIKAYINDAVNLGFSGPSKIFYELKKLGFKENYINDYLNLIENNIWEEKIRKYITKKINSNNKLSSSMLKLKIVSDLQNKGFYKEDIMTILNEFTFSDNIDIYNKEYEKQKNKLSKKYSGKDLEYQIKVKMYQKGFKN